jgi:addiction module HigA family antidote
MKIVSRERKMQLIMGKRGITAESALDLVEVLGTSEKLWMNLQATWDLDVAVRRRVVA